MIEGEEKFIRCLCSLHYQSTPLQPTHDSTSSSPGAAALPVPVKPPAPVISPAPTTAATPTPTPPVEPLLLRGGDLAGDGEMTLPDECFFRAVGGDSIIWVDAARQTSER